MIGNVLSFEHVIISPLDKKQQLLALKLCHLPYFTQHSVSRIRVIEIGLSQPCFEVKYDSKNYFAKYLIADSIEPLASQLAASHGLSPKPVYVDDNWLITEFIAGEGLEQCHQPEAEKLTVMLALLARCHRIPSDISDSQYYLTAQVVLARMQKSLPKLDITTIIRQILQHTELSSTQEQVLTPLLTLLQQNLAKAIEKVPSVTQVFCHGDANFSNVIVGESDTEKSAKVYQLIDFECACIAPIEYDLAMLMAVNGIDASKITMVNASYQQALISLNHQEKALEIVDNLSGKITTIENISVNLVTRYLDLSLLINGLWYLSHYQSRKQSQYKLLAIKQLMALATRYPQTSFFVDEMR